MNYEAIQSNAVLIPHLNSPLKNDTYVYRPASYKHKKPEPVSEAVKRQRQLWCERQLVILESNPSNAVLVEQTV